MVVALVAVCLGGWLVVDGGGRGCGGGGVPKFPRLSTTHFFELRHFLQGSGVSSHPPPKDFIKQSRVAYKVQSYIDSGVAYTIHYSSEACSSGFDSTAYRPYRDPEERHIVIRDLEERHIDHRDHGGTTYRPQGPWRGVISSTGSLEGRHLVHRGLGGASSRPQLPWRGVISSTGSL